MTKIGAPSPSPSTPSSFSRHFFPAGGAQFADQATNARVGGNDRRRNNRPVS